MRITRGRIAAFLLGVFLSVVGGSYAFDLPVDGNPSVRDGGLYAVKSGTTNTKQSLESTSGALHVNVVAGAAGGSTTPTDNFANPTNASNAAAFGMVWDSGGGNWDKYPGNTNGAIVQGSVPNGSPTSSLPLLMAGYDTGNLIRRILNDTSGRLIMVGAAAHDAPAAGSPLLSGAQARIAVPTAVADNDAATTAADPYGQIYVRNDHLNRIRCTVTVSTATTIQAVGGSCAAPGAGLSIHVTDILFATNAPGTAADAFPTLKYGTGGTCGTGTTVFWGAFGAGAAASPVHESIVQAFATPIKIPANNEICWINSVAGSKFIVISGFIAP